VDGIDRIVDKKKFVENQLNQLDVYKGKILDRIARIVDKKKFVDLYKYVLQNYMSQLGSILEISGRGHFFLTYSHMRKKQILSKFYYYNIS
jgi:hypothetical protein